MNSSPINLTAQQLRHAAGLQERIEALQGQLAKMLGSPAGNSRATAAPRKRRMSAVAIARIRAAQKARWARIKARRGSKPKRKLSAAAKAKLAAIARARWKQAKA